MHKGVIIRPAETGITGTILVGGLQEACRGVRRVQPSAVHGTPLHIRMVGQELEEAIVAILYLRALLVMAIGIVADGQGLFAAIGR